MELRVIESGRGPEGITMPAARSKTMEIINGLMADIRAGRLKPGDRIPSARELRDRYDCSGTPVREAVNYLKARGVVVGEAGIAVFVADPLPPGVLTDP